MSFKTRTLPIVAGLGALALLLTATLAMRPAPTAPQADDEPAAKEKEGGQAQADPALERARREASMLDALYKNAVVSVTERYPKGPPAIMVGKDVFAAMEKAGYHSARLVGATEVLMNEENAPKTPFEKRAVEQIRDGEATYEEVVETDDGRRLLVATVVPAVHARCAACHAVNEGDLLGFLRYDLKVD